MHIAIILDQYFTFYWAHWPKESVQFVFGNKWFAVWLQFNYLILKEHKKGEHKSHHFSFEILTSKRKSKNNTEMSADSELSSILNRRQQINDALENGETVKQTFRPGNIYTEFHEFSRKEIKDYQSTFNT